MLDKFFSTLQRFNGDVPMSDQFKKDLTKHFSYKWSNDLNQFIEDPSESKIFDQLPDFVQDKIYCQFLYMDFIREF